MMHEMPKIGFEEQEKKIASRDTLKQWIVDLRRSSPFSRNAEESGEEVLTSREGEVFKLARVQQSIDPRVEKIHRLCAAEFDEEENDTIETLRDAVELPQGAYHLIENAEGQEIAVSNAWHLPLQPIRGEEREHPNASVLFVAYIVTNEEFRGKGLAPELYQNMFEFGEEQARSNDQELRAIIGEAVDGVERFLNKMGRKRAYYEDVDGNVREIPYLQGPIDWDLATGMPLRNPTSEHLMLRLTDGKEDLSTGELLEMVLAIYEENYIFLPKYFESETAYENCRKNVLQLLYDLEHTLTDAKDGKIFLMSREERERKQTELAAEGKSVFEIQKNTDSEEENERE